MRSNFLLGSPKGGDHSKERQYVDGMIILKCMLGNWLDCVNVAENRK
jgi:hypothetical protein